MPRVPRFLGTSLPAGWRLSRSVLPVALATPVAFSRQEAHEVSLSHVTRASDHSDSNHQGPPRCRRLLSFNTCLPAFAGFGFTVRSRARRGCPRPNRVRAPSDWSFTSSCSPRGLAAAAVGFDHGLESFCPEGTSTPQFVCARRRTSADLTVRPGVPGPMARLCCEACATALVSLARPPFSHADYRVPGASGLLGP